jgi:hypothetical protein
MNRNKPLVLVAVALLMVFFAVGCDRLWNQPAGEKTHSAWHWAPGGPAFTDPMMAGATQIGTAKIERPTPSPLLVGFTMNGTRKMSKTCVHVCAGNLNPPSSVNSWAYKTTHSPRVASKVYNIAWNQAWVFGGKITVGMYCEYENNLDCKTWKKIYKWTVTIPYKELDLPPNPVEFRGWHPNGTYSYWKVEFRGVPAGYDISNYPPYYDGWCAEQTTYMYQNTWYWCQPWSALSPALPARCQNAGWDNVCYLLNNKLGTFWDQQAAIWYLLGNGGYPSTVPAQTMVAQANANGDGWKPLNAGDLIAVVLDVPVNQQLIFVEVDP